VARVGRRIRSSDRAFYVANYAVLGLFGLSVFYPLAYVVSASFSSASAVISGRVWLWPVDITFVGYRAVLAHRLIRSAYRNSLFYMAAGTAINVVMTMLAAYPLSRKDFRFRRPISFLFLFTMYFGGGLIPTYLLYIRLGLVNNIWAMLIPGALNVYNALIVKSYIQNSIPEELLESSHLLGCSDWQYLLRVVVPLSGPVIAVITLTYAVGHWNAWFNAMILLRKENLLPLQLVLKSILINNAMSTDITADLDVTSAVERENLRQILKFALIVVASAPMLVLYPFVQKYFIRGIMVGTLK
jgi:putative aldouronate transport system permease protein